MLSVGGTILRFTGEFITGLAFNNDLFVIDGPATGFKVMTVMVSSLC